MRVRFNAKIWGDLLNVSHDIGIEIGEALLEELGRDQWKNPTFASISQGLSTSSDLAYCATVASLYCKNQSLEEGYIRAIMEAFESQLFPQPPEEEGSTS